MIKHLATKLQKRDLDIYRAHMMIDDSIKALNDLRLAIDKIFDDWFLEASHMADLLGTEITSKRVSSRQSHRSNAPSESPKEHFKRNVAIPFVDHLLNEMTQRFKLQQNNSVAIFSLLPTFIILNSNLDDLASNSCSGIEISHSLLFSEVN